MALSSASEGLGLLTPGPDPQKARKTPPRGGTSHV
jgi:hypothetical protein